MPLVGLNCYGIPNYLDGAMLWPDQQGGKRVDEGVAVITMSSNVGFNLTMQRRGVPIAYMISLGNKLSSEAAQKIVVSHTALLAGSDALVGVLFERLGVARADSLEALKELQVLGPLNGGRIGAMSTSRVIACFSRMPWARA